MSSTEPLRKMVKAARLARVTLWRKALLSHGVAAAIEHAALLRELDIALVLDVGANRGQFSLLAREIFPTSYIHAFEPLERPRLALQGLFARDPRFKVHPFALGSADSSVDMYLTDDEDSSSLLEPLPSQEKHFPGTRTSGRSLIRVRRLDLLEEVWGAGPTLMKLDTQGTELDVLQGASELIERVDYVYTEVSFIPLYRDQPLAGDVNRWLLDYGFRLVGVGNTQHGRQSHRPIQADLLYVRDAPAGG